MTELELAAHLAKASSTAAEAKAAARARHADLPAGFREAASAHLASKAARCFAVGATKSGRVVAEFRGEATETELKFAAMVATLNATAA